MNGSDSRIWSELIFEFLMEKLKYDGLTSNANGTAVNMLDASSNANGPPEIMCESVSVYAD